MEGRPAFAPKAFGAAARQAPAFAEAGSADALAATDGTTGRLAPTPFRLFQVFVRNLQFGPRHVILHRDDMPGRFPARLAAAKGVGRLRPPPHNVSTWHHLSNHYDSIIAYILTKPTIILNYFCNRPFEESRTDLRRKQAWAEESEPPFLTPRRF
jgi:hypothetical protein